MRLDCVRILLLEMVEWMLLISMCGVVLLCSSVVLVCSCFVLLVSMIMVLVFSWDFGVFMLLIWLVKLLKLIRVEIMVRKVRV